MHALGTTSTRGGIDVAKQLVTFAREDGDVDGEDEKAAKLDEDGVLLLLRSDAAMLRRVAQHT